MIWVDGVIANSRITDLDVETDNNGRVVVNAEDMEIIKEYSQSSVNLPDSSG
jgi:NADH dehydrogenase FAD-containing subunit